MSSKAWAVGRWLLQTTLMVAVFVGTSMAIEACLLSKECVPSQHTIHGTGEASCPVGTIMLIERSGDTLYLSCQCPTEGTP